MQLFLEAPILSTFPCNLADIILLYVQENTEEKVDYLRQLREFLKDQPPLGDASEEINIRDALLDLEKQVTQYCRKHQIISPPPSKVWRHSSLSSPDHNNNINLVTSTVTHAWGRSGVVKAVWTKQYSLAHYTSKHSCLHCTLVSSTDHTHQRRERSGAPSSNLWTIPQNEERPIKK